MSCSFLVHPVSAGRWRGRRPQSGEEVRLYACGGDGTLNEVVNGVVGLSATLP